MKEKKTLFTVLEVAMALFIFVVSQLACGVVAAAVYAGIEYSKTGNIDPDAIGMAMGTNADVVSYALLLSSLLTIFMIIVVKIALKRDILGELNAKRCDWKIALFVCILLLLGAQGISILEEKLNLPNLMADTLTDMSGNVVGMLSIAILGPIAEEYVFRSGMIGGMLARGVKPWVAILVSSFLFGLIHINPAQVPFAMLIGVALGMMYVKSGSIIPSCICHILNNSIAVYTMIKYSDNPDITYSEMIGSEAWTNVIMVVSITLSVAFFIYYWRRRKAI